MGAAEAQRQILEAVACGELTPGEASTLSGIVEARRKAREERTPSILDGFARAPEPAQAVAPASNEHDDLLDSLGI